MEKPLILAIAAEAEEFAPLMRKLGLGAPAPGYPVRAEGESERYRWRLVANGPGPRLAREAVRLGFHAGRPDFLLSTGFCGGLNPSLTAGEIFVATEIRSGQERFPALAPAAPRTAARGKLVSEDRVLLDAFEKARLHVAYGYDAADMEAAEVARAAGSEMPFLCIRAVSDAFHDDMPLDFNRYRDEQGRFDRRRIARAVALRPWKIPGLLRLGRDCKRAASNLADFLLECEI